MSINLYNEYVRNPANNLSYSIHFCKLLQAKIHAAGYKAHVYKSFGFSNRIYINVNGCEYIETNPTKLLSVDEAYDLVMLQLI
jgi:hypothetical protein